jgi:hypothetical protein
LARTEAMHSLCARASEPRDQAILIEELDALTRH